MALSACGPNPVIGRWGRVRMSGPVTFAEQLVLGMDGSLVVTFTGSMGCTGTITSSGARWATSAMNNVNTLTISGTPTCTGMVACMIGGVSVPADCMSVQGGVQPEAVQYTLTGNNTTLTLTSGSDSRVYTRSM